MTRVDQFESVFRSADKPVYHHEELSIRRALIVTDLRDPEPYVERVAAFLRTALGDALTVESTDASSLSTVLDALAGDAPDLVVTYRNVGTEAWRWPHGLGGHVEVLSQVSAPPLLLLPHPEESTGAMLENTDRVMALADHLQGDHALVRYAVRFTQPSGRLWLAHVEDEADFERFLDAVSKVPAIDTDIARDDIHAQLLKEPADYIETCREALKTARPDLAVEGIVTGGSHLAEYERLVEQHELDLLVLHGRDDAQMAMHGRAYPLAVELRTTPLLLVG